MSRRYTGSDKPRSRGGKQRRHKAPQSPLIPKATDSRALAEQAIRTFLKNSPRGFKSRSLFNLLGRPLEYTAFRALLKDLLESGKIRRDELRRWCWSAGLSRLAGTLMIQSSGHAFLLPDDGSERIFIHRKQLGRYLQDDLVEIELVQARRAGREGRIVALLKRQMEFVVGRLGRYSRSWVLLPESARFGSQITINGSLPEDAEDGQMVRARILNRDASSVGKGIVAEVVKVLGHPGAPTVLQETVKAAFNLQVDFPDDVLKECEGLSAALIAPEEGRLDLRDQLCFTIDPPDARDFDDAVSIKALDDGGWELGVHIADVSHFVREGGALDRSALARGCSVYLVGEVVPMLPHLLSSDLCSLVEGEDRCCFSAIMRFSAHGTLKESRFSPTLIRSRKCFSYADVQQKLDQFPRRRPTGFDPKVEYAASEIDLSLYHMDRLWRLLKRKRLKKGALDFAIPEARFELDRTGTPVAVEAKISREANFLIEEFMLAANQAVALRLSQQKRLCPYRVHPAPSGEKLQRFRDFASHLGVTELPDLSHVSAWQELIAEYGKGESRLLLQEMVLRSMMKARYDLEELGHFGLGFKHYTHFTSPIRRYPDLIVHRLLKALLCGNADLSREELQKQCLVCNRREIVAQEAERDSIRLHQVLYLRQHLGSEFTGMIRGVERFGLFVELPEVMADGLLAIEELPKDRWVYDSMRWELKGQGSGLRFSVGQEVRVQLIRADLEGRQIDFKFVSD